MGCLFLPPCERAPRPLDNLGGQEGARLRSGIPASLQVEAWTGSDLIWKLKQFLPAVLVFSSISSPQSDSFQNGAQVCGCFVLPWPGDGSGILAVLSKHRQTVPIGEGTEGLWSQKVAEENNVWAPKGTLPPPAKSRLLRSSAPNSFLRIQTGGGCWLSTDNYSATPQFAHITNLGKSWVPKLLTQVSHWPTE